MLESANTNHTSFSGCNVPGEVGGTAFQNGVSTSFAYEQAINRLHEMSTADPGSGTIQDFSYNHDSNGKIRGANDNVIPSNGQTFTYDFLNRLVASQGAYGPSGQTIGVDTKYDVNGRPWEKSLPYFVGNEAPRYIQYAYDCLGRLTQTSYPDGTYTTAAYSQALTTYTDRNGNQKTVQQDPFGRTTQVTEFLSQAVSFNTTYQYDALGNLLLVTDTYGNTTPIAYDSLSRKIQMTDPAMGQWHYYYDNNGNLTKQIDAKNQPIAFQYDSLNRPVLKEYPDQTNVSYTYDETWSTDAVGRLTTAVDNSGSTQFFYDNLGRTSQVTRTIDSVQYNTGMMYDSLSHITQIAYPDGDTANYSYDGAGNMSAVSNSASVPYASFSGYNALGQVGQIAFQNNAITSLSYYPSNNRLQTMSTTTPVNGTVQSLAYGYDNNGNVLSITDNVTSANSQTFTYDGLNRLVTAQSQAYNTINISYDLIGNIQTNADSGNPADRTSEALTYDYDNRVTGIGATSFVYDYTGARVKKTTGASITTYVSRLFDITNGTVTKHIFAGGTRIASKSGSSIYYYHPDHLGSLSIATDGSGTQRQAVTYYPFGEVRTNTGTVDLPYKFTGHELDPETGLYYCGARYYDAPQGRFITPDTIVQSPGDPQTLNRYAYARNNPLLYTDPSGHAFGIDDLIIGIIIGAALGATISAITGANIALGALTGAISGAAFALAGGAIESWGLIQQVEAGNQLAIAEASAIHFAAGAASGAINAAITGGNVGLSSLTSGISEGISYAVGAGLGMMPGTTTGWYFKLAPEQQFFAGLAVRTGVGALVGGATAELAGGEFIQGMGQGAWTAAYGFIFNETLDAFGKGMATGSDAELSQALNANASCGDWHVWDMFRRSHSHRYVGATGYTTDLAALHSGAGIILHFRRPLERWFTQAEVG